ncbi:hypothetical protein BpHYR1_015616 [Brachionus plicatilis]|uniref:Uncharacterized protein n=1 Tax=Brachionus plicatilis TaxID=10195 RepID=A0A3M7PRG5_BRAPC|nr:hypothetical protein BpHYR1_015616 [Brachionus plicatilis]
MMIQYSMSRAIGNDDDLLIGRSAFNTFKLLNLLSYLNLIQKRTWKMIRIGIKLHFVKVNPESIVEIY